MRRELQTGSSLGPLNGPLAIKLLELRLFSHSDDLEGAVASLGGQSTGGASALNLKAHPFAVKTR